jgi:hypothetical protein
VNREVHARFWERPEAEFLSNVVMAMKAAVKANSIPSALENSEAAKSRRTIFPQIGFRQWWRINISLAPCRSIKITYLGDTT